MKYKTLNKAMAVGILAISSSFAMAIPTFSFTESAGFEFDDVPIASYENQINGVTSPAQDVYDTMTWYDNPNSTLRSSLLLTSFTGAVAIDTWTTISRLTHFNNPIPSNPLHGWDAPQDIFGRLRILDGVSVRVDDTDPIQITLEETLNQAPCVIANPTGSPVPCDDRFTFTAIGLAPLDFTALDGSLWTASFTLANFVNSAFNGIDTVYTAESQVSSLDVQMMLTERPSSVPEPATLGILGLGLLGLGLAKRRKQNA